MNRIFQTTVWSAMIITIGVFVALCGYNTYVYFYNQGLYKEAEQETVTRTVKFEKEAIRMSVLAKQSHEKCPSQLTLEAHASNRLEPKAHVSSGIEIPAYPHLSAIYIYIHPNVFKHYHFISRPTTVSTFSKEALQKTIRYSHFKNGERRYGTAPIKTLLSTMPLLFIEALEQSLAYCGIDKDGNPLKVIVVNKIQHANLEQKDALTIVLGITLSTGIYSPTIHARLYTHQYIPRWNIFPETYKSTHTRNTMRKKHSYTYSVVPYYNDSFKIHNLQVSRSYNPFSLLSPKEESIKEWLTDSWGNKETLRKKAPTGSPAAFIKYKRGNRMTKEYLMELRILSALWYRTRNAHFPPVM